MSFRPHFTPFSLSAPFSTVVTIVICHFVSHWPALGSSPGVDATCDYLVGSLVFPEIFFSGIMVFPSPVSLGVLSVLETVKRHPLFIKCIVFFFTICLFVFFIYLFILFICIHIFFNPRPEGLFTRLCGNLYFKPCCVLFPATDCFFRSPSQEVQNSTRKRTFKVQAPANVYFYHYDRWRKAQWTQCSQQSYKWKYEDKI